MKNYRCNDFTLLYFQIIANKGLFIRRASAQQGDTFLSFNTPRKPQYDLNKGIVHIGVGNFARAFLFMRINDMMNKQQGFEWGVVGVNHSPAKNDEIASTQYWNAANKATQFL
jgi:hypothetical protein